MCHYFPSISSDFSIFQIDVRICNGVWAVFNSWKKTHGIYATWRLLSIGITVLSVPLVSLSFPPRGSRLCYKKTRLVNCASMLQGERVSVSNDWSLTDNRTPRLAGFRVNSNGIKGWKDSLTSGFQSREKMFNISSDQILCANIDCHVNYQTSRFVDFRVHSNSVSDRKMVWF